MKAIRLDHHGEPTEVLAVAERPAPEPVDGEVRFLFRRDFVILARPVNPSDLLYVRGHHAGVRAQLPTPVGCEDNYTPFTVRTRPGLRNPGGLP
jgi:NADPH2:quinone reductase